MYFHHLNPQITSTQSEPCGFLSSFSPPQKIRPGHTNSNVGTSRLIESVPRDPACAVEPFHARQLNLVSIPLPPRSSRHKHLVPQKTHSKPISNFSQVTNRLPAVFCYGIEFHSCPFVLSFTSACISPTPPQDWPLDILNKNAHESCPIWQSIDQGCFLQGDCWCQRLRQN